MKTSTLTKERRWLVEQCQRLQFGAIKGLRICRGQPVIDPPPEMVSDVKLGTDVEPIRLPAMEEWALKIHFVHLFREFDSRQDYVIDVLEIQNGLPFKRRAQEVAI